MSQASYHSETDSLSCSQFKLFCESPAEYYATFRAPPDESIPKRKPTNPMKLGTIEHALLLEKKPIEAIARAYPTSCLNVKGGLKPAAAKEFEAKIWPLVAAKEEQIEQALRIYRNVMKTDLANILRATNQFEQRIEAEVEGVQCRCKPDIHSETLSEQNGVIYDLKVTERVKPDDWWKNSKALRYNIQDAFYSLVAEAKYGKPYIFRFWAIENVGLCRVQPYWYDERSREISKDYVRKKLIEFRERDAANNWTDDWSNEGVVGPWDLGQNDADNELVEWDETEEG